MEHVVLVHRVNAKKHLLHKHLAVRHAELLLALDNLVQVAVHQLHGNVQAVLLNPHAEVSQADDVGVMLQEAHQAQLSKGVLGVPFVGAHRGYLLYRDALPCVRVLGSAHYTVGAFANDAQGRVLWEGELGAWGRGGVSVEVCDGIMIKKARCNPYGWTCGPEKAHRSSSTT